MASESLATRTIRGTLWTGSAFALQILTTLVFYRVLAIDDMGLFEWSLFIVMLLALLCDLGLGSALVQKREAGDSHFNAAFWVCLVVGAAVTAAVQWNIDAICGLVAGQDASQMAPILAGMMWIGPSLRFLASSAPNFSATYSGDRWQVQRSRRPLPMRQVPLACWPWTLASSVLCTALWSGRRCS